jgi:translation initiation factor IF-3
VWDEAEAILGGALEELSLDYVVNEGDGAFYGPKIDLHFEDSLGRSWQLGTVQVDFNFPERFDLTYTGADNADHRVVMLHRALFGSFERFIGILLEDTGGELPLWLAPVQAVVLPIADRHDEPARRVVAQLRAGGVRAEIDDRTESVGRKIRDNELQKIPFMLVVGDREAADGTVSVREHGKGDTGTVTVDEFARRVAEDSSVLAALNVAILASLTTLRTPSLPVPRRFDRRPPERDTTRINERIRVPEVRLIDETGAQQGVMATDKALKYAQSKDLDLVEVAPEARPPVTRVLDYSKYKYEQAQKQKQARKHQTSIVVREIKFRPKIADHDYETKKSHVERFILHKDKVKVTIMFRGREVTHPERGEMILNRLAEDLSEIIQVDQRPTQDGRNMTMMLSPSKAVMSGEITPEDEAPPEVDGDGNVIEAPAEEPTTRGPQKHHTDKSAQPLGSPEQLAD